MSELARINEDQSHLVESLIVKGDMAKLTSEERGRYYLAVCNSVGLNPLTKPFDFITLNGKLVLYPLRGAAEQLRKNNQISIEIITQQIEGELFTVHVRATDNNGRKDEDFGVVTLGKLTGDARANCIMKGITKAKRRVTLSICGLGMLDETEHEDATSDETKPKSTNVRQMMRDDIKEMGGLSEQEMRALYMELLGELKECPPDGIAAWAAQSEDSIAKLPMGWQGTLKRNIAKRAFLEVSETIDQQTGEVIWEEDGERPATANDKPADPMTIPAKLKRTQFDAKQWYKDLDGAFGGCEDMVSLGEQQAKVMTPHLLDVLANERRGAQEILRIHAMRITNQAMTSAG